MLPLPFEFFSWPEVFPLIDALLTASPFGL